MKSYRLHHLVILMTIPFWNHALKAQTSGAVAPEVTQFEPVDTTDMVNLQSGDFSYSIPVLTIPNAPGGDFPLNLNYHAGILYDQEASWVGLGWNLTPGQITRTLRGIPDDYAYGVMTRRSLSRWTHSYNVNFNYSGFSAGVNWDNHGGFGGSVGYSFSKYPNSPEVSLNWHNRNGTHAEIGFRTGPTRVSLYASSQGNWGVGLNYYSPKGSNAAYSAGMKIDSKGGLTTTIKANRNMGISLSSSGKVKPIYPVGNSAAQARINGSTITNQSSSFFVGFQTELFGISFGYNRSRSFLESYTHGVGFIHTDKLNGPNLNNPVAGEADAYGDGINVWYDSGVFFDSRKESIEEQVNQGLGRQFYTEVDKRNPTTRGEKSKILINPVYDFETKDYTGQLSQNYETNGYNEEESFEADYISTSYDLFNIAAQGLSGTAIPLAEQKSLGVPYDNVSHRQIIVEEDSYIFRPYREIIAGFGRAGEWEYTTPVFDQYLTKLQERLYSSVGTLDHQSINEWENPELSPATDYNMMLVSDFGTTSNPNFFRSSMNETDNPFPQMNSYIQRPSKLIRYELNNKGMIERIFVTKEDGVQYVFGRFESPLSTGFQAGETPTSIKENRVTASTDSINAQVTDNSAVHNTWETAYNSAWVLAAVLSPDYIDRDTIGPGDEDYGTYIKFTYQTVSPNFHWATPSFPALFDYYDPDNPTNISSTDPISSQFAYMGRSLNENRHSWQREFGVKDIIVPLTAETKSHVAYFEVDYAQPRKDNLPAPEITWNLDENTAEYSVGLSNIAQRFLEYSLDAGNLDLITDDIAKVEIRDAFCATWAGIEPARSWEKDLIALPIGLANRMALKPGDVVPTVNGGTQHEVVMSTPTTVFTTLIGGTVADDAPEGCDAVSAKATIVYLGAIERTGQEYFLISRICPSFTQECPTEQMCPSGDCQVTDYFCGALNEVFWHSNIQTVRFSVEGGNRAAKLKSLRLYQKELFYNALTDIDTAFDVDATKAMPDSCTFPECNDDDGSVSMITDGSIWPENDPSSGAFLQGNPRANTACDEQTSITNNTFTLTAKHVGTTGTTMASSDFRLLDYGLSTASQLEKLKGYLNKTEFVTDYSLASGTPNSVGGVNGARLTLRDLKSYTSYFDNGNYYEVLTSKGYEFRYYGETGSVGFDNGAAFEGYKPISEISYWKHYNRDPWGFISVPNDVHQRSLPYCSMVDADRFNQEVPYSDPNVAPRRIKNIPVQAAWSLSRIATPIGSDIFIEYERDSYTWVQDLPAITSNALRSYGQEVPASIDYQEYQDLTFNPGVSNSNQVFFTEFPTGINSEDDARRLTHNTTDCMILTEAEIFTKLTELELDTTTSKTNGQTFNDQNSWVLPADDNADHVLGHYKHSFIIVRVKPEKFDKGAVRFVLPIIFDGTHWKFPKHRAVKKFASWLWTTEWYGIQDDGREDLDSCAAITANSKRFSYIDQIHFFSIPNPSQGDGTTHILYPFAKHEGNYTTSSSTQWTNGGPTSGQAYDSVPYMYEGRALVGEIAGSIRVKAIEARSGTGAFTMGTYRNEYDYGDQTVDVPAALANTLKQPSSGVIFVDPPTKLYANANYSEDRRLVRSEMNPYFNVPGGNVVYGQVRLQRFAHNPSSYANTDAPTLINTTDYQFHTSKNARVLNPHLNWGSEGWTQAEPPPFHIENTIDDWTKRIFEFSFDVNQDGTPIVKPELAFTSAPGGNSQAMAKWMINPDYDANSSDANKRLFRLVDHQAKFLFASHHSQRIINNTSLIGSPQSQTYLSTQTNEPLGKTEYYYDSVFDPESPDDGRRVLKFEDRNGLLDAVITKAHQGVVFDQTFMPLLNLTGVDVNDQHNHINVDEYLIRTFGLDEIRNNFTGFRTKSIKYDNERDPNDPIIFEQETEQLAFDAYTGVPVVNISKAKNNLEQDQYLINVAATAHQVFTANNPAGSSMRELNLLAQEGWNAHLVSTDPNFYARLTTELDTTGTEATPNYLFENWNDGTTSSINAKFLSATHNYWHQAQPGQPHIWLNVSAYVYNPFDQDNPGDAWRDLPYQATNIDKTNWQFDFETTSEGTWMSEGVNTEYNRHQLPVEFKTRQETYTALHTMYDDRFAKAQFSNAELVQTYHEGFEESDADSTYINEHWRDNYAFSARNGYMANFEKVYVGTRSHKLSGDSGSAMFNKPINVRQSASANDVRDHYWVSFFLKPMSDQRSFFFSFGDAPTINNGIPIKAHTPRFQSTGADHHPPAFSSEAPQNYEIVPVDNGWFFFRAKVRVENSSENLTIFSSLGTVYLDEISIYPAAEPGERNPMDLKSVDASVAFYGYHPHHRKVISITGANGRTLRYEFNDKGELLRSFDIEGRPIQDNYFIRADEAVFSTTPQTEVPQPQ